MRIYTKLTTRLADIALSKNVTVKIMICSQRKNNKFTLKTPDGKIPYRVKIFYYVGDDIQV
jgi:hypothetical protein